jgi:hypothetical protein
MDNELAKRAINCKGWRWMPGMRMLHPLMGPARVLRVTEQGVYVAKEESLASGFRVKDDGCLPDLTDPATLGCLLALVREAWGASDLHVGRRIAGWGVWTSESTRRWETLPLCVAKADTEAAVLVAALEAADGRTFSVSVEEIETPRQEGKTR